MFDEVVKRVIKEKKRAVAIDKLKQKNNKKRIAKKNKDSIAALKIIKE